MTPTLNVLILNPLSDRHITTITNLVPQARITVSDLESAREYIENTDVIVAMGMTDIRPLFSQAPKLKWVHALTAGVENLVFPEMQNSNVVLTNSRGIHGIPVSEHVLSLILAFSRCLHVLIRQQIDKKWKRTLPDEIHEKTIGIIGLGSIGREIAKKSKGLGMQVLATKRRASQEIFVDKMYAPDKLLEMLSFCDFVVVSLPLTEETRELLRLEHFTAMKRSAYLINIARGDVIRQSDLVQALQEGLIRGAGLDVFDQEPLPEDSPLWDMPNVIISPHVAASSPYYLDRAIKTFADNLARYANGGEMFNIIDKSKGY
ncbi:phosphoglycerate dehydrogenase [Anaerosporomusa subterranea]|uniref:Phosphoglycerate dehydrogenase n=1 Tax=Anaerosporomusa subterranea TaxID=1794912 RepID=A0A154BMX7_ANASB|nr:D-2-hydroxyacid dehydrogenase [Anaerosporomusa subterranea]KYZ75200.1 phosphoglycerate dehydrogenase [Anaerosporomusa subterranea]